MADIGDGRPPASEAETAEGIDDLLDSLTTPGRSSAGSSTVWSALKQRGLLPAVLGVCIAGVLGSVILSWLALARAGSDDSSGATNIEAAAGVEDQAAAADGVPAQITAVMRGLGFDDVEVRQQDSIIVLLGSVPSEADRNTAIGAARALAGDLDLDAAGLVVGPGAAPAETEGDGSEADLDSDRADALQAELDRIDAVTPLIFASGESGLTELQLRVLNNVASTIQAYPDLQVTVVSTTDDKGSDADNEQLSLTRAATVESYLVSQGVPDARLQIEARGELGSSGSAQLAGLERRVAFEVVEGPGIRLAPNETALRIALVAPSPRNDLAFTQSMVDSLNVIAGERGNVEIAITDNTFIPSEAAKAIRNYAEQDYDLIIAHGVEFAADLIEIVEEFPTVTFAWGTATETFGLPNLYAYDAAAEEGGYVMGAMGAMLSSSNVLGVVGPIEVGDAARYINGFEAGAKSRTPEPMVQIAYTGSFADITLAAETANAHIAAGADVLTGSAEMVIGAVAVAEERNALWFGTQAAQDSLAPGIVVASQVYHWEVALRPIISDIDNGTIEAHSHVIDMANNGLVIHYNPGFDLPANVREEAELLIGNIITGTLAVPAG